jgi:hypothetical protein
MEVEPRFDKQTRSRGESSGQRNIKGKIFNPSSA